MKNALKKECFFHLVPEHDRYHGMCWWVLALHAITLPCPQSL
jgi:hypothetical protein